MSAATDSAAELLTRLASQVQPPCELGIMLPCPIHGAHQRRCGETAAWVLRTPCDCGTTDVALICDDHAEKVRSRTGTTCCSGCHAPNDSARMSLEKI